MHLTPRRVIWWRVALCIVGGLLLISALVVSVEVPAEVTQTSGIVGAASHTTVLWTNTAISIWIIALALAGVAAILVAIVFPRRGSRAG